MSWVLDVWVLDVLGAGCPGCWMSWVLDVRVLDVPVLDVWVLDVCEPYKHSNTIHPLLSVFPSSISSRKSEAVSLAKYIFTGW